MTRSDQPSQIHTAANANAAGDLSAFGVLGALWRNRRWIIIPVMLAAIGSLAFVFLATPRYLGEAQILVERQETAFTRPEREQGDGSAQLDQEAIASEVQVIQSVDVIQRVIRDQGLDKLAEFNPALRPPGLLDTLLGLVLGAEESGASADQLILDTFRQHLAVFAVSESRVIVIEFWSEDPELAARVTNAIADAYIEVQKAAIVETTSEASTWLERQIADLRGKVATAERRVEEFRARNNLFTSTNASAGQNNRPATLASQELSELSSQLTQARAQRSDAQARARLINELLQTGRSIEARDVFDSPLIARLQEERSRVRAQIAELSSTLLPAHPRMQELTAQRQNIERQIRTEATRVVRGLENDAAVAAAREQQIIANLDALKQSAATSNEAEVQLRALEREANAQRQLLESYLTRFREAVGRTATELTPPRARIISRATVPAESFYPSKKLIPILAVIGTGVLTGATILTVELARLYANQPAGPQAFGLPASPVHAPSISAGPYPGGRREPELVPVSPRLAEAMRSAPPEDPIDGDPDPVGSVAYAGDDVVPEPSSVDTGSSKAAIPDRPTGADVDSWAPRAIDQLLMVAAVNHDAAGLDDLIGRIREIADQGQQVLAIDLRPGAPLLRGATGSAFLPGFHDIQSGSASFNETIFGDALSRMNVMGAGQSVLAADVTGAEPLFKALTAAYDLVVLVAPPLNRAPWHVGLGRFCDCVTLMAAQRDLATSDLRRLVKRLENAGNGRVELFVDGALAEAA